MLSCDAIVVGAGFAGAVTARRLAEHGRRVLLIERRPHLAGNAYDCFNREGILIHRYGPHIFHTSDAGTFSYLSRFSAFRDYQHHVLADVPGAAGRFTLPVPFNLCSLHRAFPPAQAQALEETLLTSYGYGTKVPILALRRHPDPALARLADYVYETVFLRYTMKQWGQTPEEIAPETTARVPVSLSRDCRYFQDRYQGLPVGGYTALFTRMLSHENIRLLLSTPARALLSLTGEGVTLLGAPFSGPVVYTGAVDELFDNCYGPLPYRTLHFDFETLPCARFQSVGTVNYTADRPYTRITEFSHLTGQTFSDRTAIVREYPAAYTGAPDETPYYPIQTPENHALYQRYAALAERIPNLHLLGRLAEYQYYNMDTIVARALQRSQQLVSGGPSGRNRL